MKKPFLRARGITWLPLLTLALLAGACTRPVIEPPVAMKAPPQVRVGLLVDSASVELYAPGGLTVVDPDGERQIGAFGAGDRIVVRSRPEAAAGAAAGELTLGDEPTGVRLLTIRPGGDGIVYIGGKPYRGTAVVRSTGPGTLTAINRVDMETYLLGVVPKEIGKVGEDLLEAAKAQAVAARTYAIRYMGRRESLGFDVFATVQDQVYGGVETEHEPVSRAVRETAGEILTFGGEPIQAFYSSTCAGHTASIEEVWPGEPHRPFLTSISDINPDSGQSFCRSSNRFKWTERWTPDSLAMILSETLADSLRPGQTFSDANLHDLWVVERTPEGRVQRMAIAAAADTFYVGGDRVRWVLRRPNGGILNSAKFDVQVMRDPEGRPTEVVAYGGGWGHGIGMCQVGAMGRARAGYDYRDILRAYYQGAEIRSVY